MEQIVNYKGVALIKKYDRSYIRFEIGQHAMYLCDLPITNEEAAEIVSDNEKIKTIRDSYKKQVPWTKEFFFRTGLLDYFRFECGMDEKAARNAWEKVHRYPDLEIELYEAVMYGKLRRRGAVCECGLTARSLVEEQGRSVSEAFLLLADLRDNPEKAKELPLVRELG